MPGHRIFTMPFSAVYPMYVQKAERKGRTRAEVDRVVCWLTGYDAPGLRRQIERNTDFEGFFAQAPRMNPDRSLITGVVCGVRVESVEDPLMKKVRQLDKLVDELAKGRPIEKILRTSRDASGVPGAGGVTPGPATTPDGYIAGLAGWRKAYASALRAAVKDAAPGLDERLKWGHLVNFLNGPVLLIRAESARLLFGFWRGQRLRDIEPRLMPGGKYEMATLEIREDTPLARETVTALAARAAELNRAVGDPTSANTPASAAPRC